jgi:hypothetical protein
MIQTASPGDLNILDVNGTAGSGLLPSYHRRVPKGGVRRALKPNLSLNNQLKVEIRQIVTAMINFINSFSDFSNSNLECPTIEYLHH